MPASWSAPKARAAIPGTPTIPSPEIVTIACAPIAVIARTGSRCSAARSRRVEISVQGMVDRGNQQRTDVTVFNSVKLEFAISGTDGATAAQLVEGFKRR